MKWESFQPMGISWQGAFVEAFRGLVEVNEKIYDELRTLRIIEMNRFKFEQENKK